jgi:hypothetical protein
MNLPGSTQVALGKMLFERYPWQEFEPHPEWAKYVDEMPPTYGPYATGIPDHLRLIYMPEARAVRVLKLEKNVDYRAEAFDPVSGKTIDLGRVIADEQNKWTANKPAAFTDGDDWVLVLNAATGQQ